MTRVLTTVVLVGCAPENLLWGTLTNPERPQVTVLPIDHDGDGLSVEEGDCNDLEPRIPYFDPTTGLMREVCDGLDNDCNGIPDQDSAGLRACDAQDRFDQVMATDVLFVLDHTFAMQEYWDRAAAGAGALVRHIVGDGADSHIGVISTDMSDPKLYNGKLLSPADYSGLWLTGNDPALDGVVRQRFLTGAMTEREPQPYGTMEGARAALNASIVELGDAYNNGFFRGWVPLNVVFITSDEDTSMPDNMALAAMLAKFRTGAPTKFYALTQTSDFDCYGYRTYPATTLISLAQTTGGFYESYCLDDYTGFLSSVGQAISTDALTDTFVLEHPAQLPTVTVRTQDEGKEPVDWAGTWALTDPSTLVFPDTPPPAGMAIIIDYEIDWRYEPAVY